MQYVHVRNLEKYHLGYTDRKLIWGKIYFNMVQGDPDCEMITSEIDWCRLVKFILLELQAQKPIPIDEGYLTRKGFNLKERKIELTLQALQSFIETVTEPLQNRNLDKEVDVDKNRVDKDSIPPFVVIWTKYPNRQGKKQAQRHYEATVKSEVDYQNIEKALANYLKCETVKKGFVKHGSTWFNDWESWISPTPEMMGNVLASADNTPKFIKLNVNCSNCDYKKDDFSIAVNKDICQYTCPKCKRSALQSV